MATTTRVMRGVVRSGLAVARARPPSLPLPTAACAVPALLSSQRWEPFAHEPLAHLALPTQGRASSSLLALMRAERFAGVVADAPTKASHLFDDDHQQFQLLRSSPEAQRDGNPITCGVGILPVVSFELSSTKKKRKLKMNRHKVKKRRKKDRFKNKV